MVNKLNLEKFLKKPWENEAGSKKRKFLYFVEVFEGEFWDTVELGNC